MSEIARRRAAVVLGVLITTAVGCDLLGRKLNPAFCAAHPDEVACRQVELDAAPDSPIDGPALCTANSDCQGSAGNPVCDLNDTKMCVQCTLTDNPCPMAMPICLNKQCNKCTQHAQCMSNVCLSDGACADETKVAYVAPGGAGSECTKTAPCGTLTAGLGKNLPFVKIAAGMVADSNITTIDGKSVTILAEPGAKLNRMSSGAILEVKNEADVQIFELEIAGATTATGEAAISVPMNGTPKLTLTHVTIDSNQGLGISVAAGTLTMSRCTVRQNAGGGIQVTGVASVFNISESFIDHNGRATSSPSDVGGAALTPNTTGSRFERNTVAFNESSGLNYRGGVSCTGPMAMARGNLIYRNTEPDGTGGTKTDTTTQNGGACQFGNSLVIVTDGGNLGFKSPASVPYDFHLTGTSPSTVVDAAGVCSGIDVDGDMRPIGSACDFGADEYHP
ncbi:MAG TPA: right-handed parallel beta-helix repeat-containing protein [Kofleriaceae bacterium]|nr:right-handed parallel beta-helix repeat-containing protein [Kofleriaceae bacterium]